MQGVNKMILVGTCTKDPIQGGQMDTSGHFCRLSLATNRRWTDKKSGEKCEETEYHNCICWGKLAGIFAQHVTKGSNLYVEGRLKTRKYQKNGIDTWSTDIVIEQFTFLPDNRKRGVESGKVQTHASNRQPQYDKPPTSQGNPPVDSGGFVPPVEDDGIPF